MKSFYKISLFLLILTIFFSHLSAQNQCEYHSVFSEKISEKLIRSGQPQQLSSFELPVVIHQFSNYNDQQVKMMISNLNQFFETNNTSISFTLCDFIDYNEDLSLSQLEIDQLAESNNNPKAVNIYALDQAGNSGAVTSFYSDRQGWIGISRFDPTTIVHEMGHYLGLAHTHNLTFPKELVDGSNCEIAGDFFCDTPADPNLNLKVDNDCRYIGNEVDANGDIYQPDPSNAMSYTNSFCRTSFSPEQISAMLNTIELLYSNYSCLTSNVLETEKSNYGIEVSPNPTNGWIDIKFDNDLESLSCNVEVYNYSGRKILAINELSDSKINLSGLQTGVYILVVYLENRVIRKLIFLI